MDYIINFDDWNNMFITKHKNLISSNYFFKHFKVSTSSSLLNVLDYLKRFPDFENRKKNIEVLIHVFNNRHIYLQRFFNNSLKPINSTFEDIFIKLGNKPIINNNIQTKTKNLIRNLHLNNILLNTQTDLPNLKPFLKILIDFFVYNIIDYKLITPSILDLIKNKGFASVMSGIYFKASIMNPYLVFNISKLFIKKPNSKVFSPTLGWSSYLYGFMENNYVSEYLGIDVIDDVCLKSIDYFKHTYPNKKIDVICQPSELVYKDKSFLNKHKNYFDFIFFSPPYFKLELYPGKLQSTSLYPEYNQWLTQYWENTIKLCFTILKKNHFFVYILSGYGSVNSDTYNINMDMNNITTKYFKHYDELPMINSNVNFTKHKKTNEIIYVFKKV
jgi:hypothetical protein